MAWKTRPRVGAAPGCAPEPGDTFGWLTPGRFAAGFGLLLLVGWPQVILGWESFFYVDYATFGYPLAFYHRAAIWNGELPLWNPLNNCGMPFLAQWNTLTLYPFSLIYLALPLPWSLAMYCLAHLYLAGLGMYFLAWRWTGSRLAAAVAGAVFGFNGLTWFGLMWPNNLAALGWMPWVVLGLERAWCEGRGWIAGGAGLAALQILAGAPEVAFQTWLFIGALWVWLLVRAETPRRLLVVRGLAVGLLTTGLTAAQMLPFLDLLAHSQRNTSYGDPSVMAMPLWGWANYIVPLFHTIRTRQGLYFQPDQAWTASYYVGIATVLLGAYAIMRVRRGRVWLLAAIVSFSLLMALGAPGRVYAWVSQVIPQMNFMRFPIKFVVLATFGLPLLAAIGLARWEQRGRGPGAGEWRWLGGLAGLLAVAALGLAIGARLHPLAGEDAAVTALNAAVRVFLLGLFIGGLVLLHRDREPRRRHLWQAALVLTLWVDVYTHSANLSPTVPARVLEPGLIREFFGWKQELLPGQSRALQGRTSFWRMLADSSADPEVDVHGRRLALFFNLNLLDDVPKFDGFFSLDIREFGDVFRQIYFGPKEALPLKRFLGISHVSNPTNSVDWTRKESPIPLITAGQAPRFVPEGEALERILEDTFDPASVVYLPLGSQAGVTAQGGAEAQVRDVRFSAHQIAATVHAQAPALVVIAHAYYHPWKAYLDGKPVSLHRANHAFQAVEVPAGTHQLHLRYQDRAFHAGLWLSGLAMAACLAMGTWSRRARSCGQPPPDAPTALRFNTASNPGEQGGK